MHRSIGSLMFLFLISGAWYVSAAQTDAERKLCAQMFGYPADATTLASEAVSLVAEAVWEASGFNGGTPTFSGTLTQSSQNLNQWSYSASPAGRLVVAFAGGPTIEFTFTAFNGYTSGTWEDFVYSHRIDFTCNYHGSFNFRIQSQATPVADTIRISRTITGTCAYFGEQMTTNLTHTGKLYYDVGSGYAFYWHWDQLRGTASAGAGTITVDEGTYFHIGHNSNVGSHVRNDQRWNSTSAVLNGVSYKYVNAQAAWARGSVLSDPGAFNVVIDVNYWLAQGQMLRNGAVWGTLKFNGQVVAGSRGPDVVLNLQSGENILVYKIIGSSATDVHADAMPPARPELFQNYPNPFNPSTTITYSMPKTASVSLRIFDALGQEVASLVNGYKATGSYSVRWDASHIPSGIYFYRMQTGEFVETKKLILLR